MKPLLLLGCVFTACVGNGEPLVAGRTGPVGGEAADTHAQFEDLRQARKEQMLLGGVQRKGNCKTLHVPIAGIDLERSLFVHDSATLNGADFSLRRVLTSMADSAVKGGADPLTTTPESLFESMWGAQEAVAPDTTCPDATGLVNGFPYSCRPEGAQHSNAAVEIDNYIPIALVNRMDNTSADFGDCGEHRIVYARNPEVVGVDTLRNFMIFEAVLPNPLEGCKEGCRAVAKWWTDLSNIADPLVRAGKLEDLYFRPLGRGPKGYQAVVTFDHYSVDGVDTNKLTSIGGQIRTNQRFELNWELKQYKAVLDCAVQPCTASIMPVADGRNPFAPLFDTTEEFAGEPWSSLVPLFEDDFLFQRTLLTTGTSAIDFTYEVNPLYNAAESDVDGTNNYKAVADAVFKSEIVDGGADFAGFTADQILNRALSLNCAGCHDPEKMKIKSPDTLGPGLSMPESLRFVHTDDVEGIVMPVGTVFGTGEGFAISDALKNDFLPARLDNLISYTNQDVCVCQPVAPAAAAARGRADRDQLSRTASDELDRAVNVYDDIRAENEALAAAGFVVDRGEESAALDAVNDVLLDSGEAMLALLARDGLADQMEDDDEEAWFAATPFRTTASDDLATEVQQALNAQPPRRTWTGSFNIH